MNSLRATVTQASPAEPTAGCRLPGLPRAVLIGSDVFRNEAFGHHHPLSIARHAGIQDLCDILGWINADCYRACEPASDAELRRFHDPDYLQTLRKATHKGRAEVTERERYAIGTMENPLFPGLYERAASTVGGAILAAQLALDDIPVFHPAGGTHHGRPDRASGFCYFNDPVFAIMTFLDEGVSRVMYVDLDAHHGDGVQGAYTEDDRVFTISIHEANRWPYSGPVEDRGGGQARNLPVPAGFNDSELDWLMSHAVLPLVHRFQPGALVVTCGADALDGDPLSRMALSNVALWQAVEALVDACPRTVVLGGGGYNPWTVVRCWTGLWGRLAGHTMPDRLPPTAQELLAGFECDLVDEEDMDPAWLTTIEDDPRPGPVREEIRHLAEMVMT
jgi:acetoin utilization protein AcuC